VPKTIFIGSATSAKGQASKVAAHLNGLGHTTLPWWSHFTPGQTLLSELDRIAGRVDGALLLFSPDITGATVPRVAGPSKLPNLNAIFELGYFYGRLGARGTAIIQYGTFYLPSDLRGYVRVNGGVPGFGASQQVRIGKRTAHELDLWVAQL
jgi:predicted nucleotide-binding protein